MDVRRRARILSVCDDEGLRSSRELLLRSTGYETESVTSYEFLKVSYVRTFDIALICTSIQPSRVGPLIEMLGRYNPMIQILDMDDLRFRAEPMFQTTVGPALLLDAVGSMCGKAGLMASDGASARKARVSHPSNATAAQDRIFSRGMKSLRT
jgi:ribosomal protein S16